MSTTTKIKTKSKVIKKFHGVEHLLIHEFIAPENNSKYSLWKNLETNKVITLKCKIPEGHSDIDLNTLKSGCLYKDTKKKGTDYYYEMD